MSGDPPVGRAQGSIVVNGSFVTQAVTGSQRYGIELARRLLARDGVRMALPAVPAPDWVPPDRQIVLGGSRLVRLAGGSAWAHSTLRRGLGSEDVLWSATPRAPWNVRRHAVTIHDVAVLEHPEWYSRSFRMFYRLHLPRLARSAAVVLTVSRFSRERIVRVLGVPPARVRVVAGGVDDRFKPVLPDEVQRVRSRYGLPSRFILGLGTLQPRKNLPRLVEAWQDLPGPTKREWPLVIAGVPGRQFATAALVTSEGTAGLHLIGHVGDEDLPGLYSAASIFAFPSLYEGFGLPPLEAMACGTPVLAGATAVAPEILEDSAVLVDPTSTAELRDGLKLLAEDETTRQELARRSPACAQRFTWDRAADELLPVLRDLHEA